ncbi:MAG: aminotransferase class I/II-fold pyridoxal phosphate-dependent enzyme, partial [Bacteroidetes bacterium]|nr:aminotransferase class I/II-fold pyridoxal phosphate-dependent enzyme [Bacteroidota bacterium]
QPGDELICADNAHVYKYEGGGIAFNSGVQARTIAGDRGRITAQQVQEVINGDDVHFPVSRLVCLENTNNRGGGSIYTLEAIREIRKVCDTHQLKLHLDGARIFNALVESDYSADMIGKCFHSVSVCLSKGLGAPVGSVLLGDAAFIKQARRVRKVFGGGMRQAGYLAAAGLYAVQHHIQRLKEDHRHAKQVQLWLKKLKGVKSIMPVDTNIIIFELESVELTNALHTHLQSLNILCNKVTASSIRFTFHLDINEDKMGGIEKALGTFVQKG